MYVPAAIRTLSFPESACFFAVILQVPLTSFKSSFDTIPCPYSEFMVSVPFPFSVRSSFEKITASILLSSIASYSAVFMRMFSESSASVMNVLSAFFTYIAALDAQVMSTLSSTSCTLAESASTTIWPSDKAPESTYVPSLDMVMILPEILTPLDAALVSFVSDLSALVPSVSDSSAWVSSALVSSVSDASASVSSPTVTVVESSARLIFTALLSS